MWLTDTGYFTRQKIHQDIEKSKQQGCHQNIYVLHMYLLFSSNLVQKIEAPKFSQHCFPTGSLSIIIGSSLENKYFAQNKNHLFVISSWTFSAHPTTLISSSLWFLNSELGKDVASGNNWKLVIGVSRLHYRNLHFPFNFVKSFRELQQTRGLIVLPLILDLPCLQWRVF